jgi:hypothetical protein
MEGAPYLKDVLHLVKQQTGVDCRFDSRTTGTMIAGNLDYFRGGLYEQKDNSPFPRHDHVADLSLTACGAMDRPSEDATTELARRALPRHI